MADSVIWDGSTPASLNGPPPLPPPSRAAPPAPLPPVVPPAPSPPDPVEPPPLPAFPPPPAPAVVDVDVVPVDVVDPLDVAPVVAPDDVPAVLPSLEQAKMGPAKSNSTTARHEGSQEKRLIMCASGSDALLTRARPSPRSVARRDARCPQFIRAPRPYFQSFF